MYQVFNRVNTTMAQYWMYYSATIHTLLWLVYKLLGYHPHTTTRLWPVDQLLHSHTTMASVWTTDWATIRTLRLGYGQRIIDWATTGSTSIKLDTRRKAWFSLLVKMMKIRIRFSTDRYTVLSSGKQSNMIHTCIQERSLEGSILVNIKRVVYVFCNHSHYHGEQIDCWATPINVHTHKNAEWDFDPLKLYDFLREQTLLPAFE